MGDGLAVGDWAEELCERLEVLRDIAVRNSLLESCKRSIIMTKVNVTEC